MIANIPTLSSSNHPIVVLPMYELFSPKNNAENSPAAFPHVSLPQKYIIKHANVAIIGGNITANSYNDIGKANV